MGRIEQVWIKTASRGPMLARKEAQIEAGAGLTEDAESKGSRPITLIEAGRWSRAEQLLGRSVDPVQRRANVLVSGIDLNESRGKVLKLGAVRVEIGGETAPCRLLDDAEPGLSEALREDWGGGAWGRALDAGDIAVGDSVEWAAD
ncbi:MAG: sulfurase [Planctomycetota bacterium]